MQQLKNRLADEKSPYLLQHAYNPVDWFPWGDEAFEKASQEDKPVFLSVGYATCHWCHVMERESFENEEIASLLNESFVCIKVDREERPDIDNLYMTVCHMMTGQGGWPLTILLTPDRRPFHAATYIPPESRFGRLGMVELIPRLADAWKNRREEITAAAGRITGVLASQNSGDATDKLDPSIIDNGYNQIMEEYDETLGGFGDAPKFPTPHKLIFLLRSGRRGAVEAATHTLTAMRLGGIFDHVGLGFHRYSTDAKWLLPHFEKMLYDQALLSLAYTEAYAVTGNILFRQVAEEILTYVLRDMTAPEGGFYSAEDADSEGEEGRFYVWSESELSELPDAEFRFCAKWWNIRPDGNFRDEATGRKTGANIPHLSEVPDPESSDRLETIRQMLFSIRENRVHPLKDTKILTDWNGMMIAALARAGRIFDDKRYLKAAERAFQFVEEEMRDDNGALWHRYRDENRAVRGQLDDYAFHIFGALELYDSTLNPIYLETALRDCGTLRQSFVDPTGGGFFMTDESAEDLIVRPKTMYDGAAPSGNSIQLYNLLRLARLTGRFELEQEAADAGKVFAGVISRSPTAFAQALSAFMYASGTSTEVVVVGNRSDPETADMIAYIRSVQNPGMTVLLKEPDQTERMARIAPFCRDQRMIEGKPTVYVCTGFSCAAPVTSLEELRSQLA